MFNFNVGDKVYYPSRSNKIYTLIKSKSECYPVLIDSNDVYETFTEDGRIHSEHGIPYIFPANERYRILLNQLYNIEFEEPVDLVQKLLNEHGAVLCIVSDNPIGEVKHVKEVLDSSSDIILTLITKYSNEGYPYVTIRASHWKYAVPVSVDEQGNITFITEN